MSETQNTSLPPSAPAPAGIGAGWLAAGAVLLAAMSSAAVVYAWNTQQRVKGLEQELVRRQQDSGTQSAEARMMAKQAQESAHDVTAKLALLDARVSESTLQRTQLEELIQSLSRSRDENVLADLDAAVRVALQLSALTGSAEPLISTLKQSEERLSRYAQPRLERVRRAVAHDLERVKGATVLDVSGLTIRIDEAVRLVDDLPLLSSPDRPAAPKEPGRAASAKPNPGMPASSGWQARLDDAWQQLSTRVADEARGLLRVTRIDQPEAMLLAPDQAYFLRENLKLRLLNARLALLSRQFDTAQSDLREAQNALDKYFDRSARRVVSATELVRQVAAQARNANLPKPEETLAAIAAAGR